MSYTLRVHWKNAPKWDHENDSFIVHLLANVSLDPEITTEHIDTLNTIPFISLEQIPSTDPNTGWISVFTCDDMATINLLQNFYTNTITPTLISPRELILEVIDNGN